MCFVRWKNKPRKKRYRNARKEVPVKGNSRVLVTRSPSPAAAEQLRSNWPRDGPGVKSSQKQAWMSIGEELPEAHGRNEGVFGGNGLWAC